jgi:HD-GYP domain-containing protein (c-di-GMP phosphodiesterase class II)
VAISGGLWEKPGPLTSTQWEQVRLHPYHTERILSRSTALEPLARLLAAADAYQAMTQDRLVISPRTAEHHVEHVYTKIGASTRAAAAMFAMEHGLLRWRSGENPLATPAPD